MAMKTIRIGQSDGKVVFADKDVHVYTRPGMGGPDQVKWVIDPPSPGRRVTVFQGCVWLVFRSVHAGYNSRCSVQCRGLRPENRARPTWDLQVQRRVRVPGDDVTDDPNIIIKS